MDELEQHDLQILNDFLGQNWVQFLQFAEENYGLEEPEATELSDRLDKAANAD